jgi:hypothetical protein
MDITKVFKFLGVVDGVVLAAVTAVGQAYPSVQGVCHSVVLVCGVVSSALAAVAHYAPAAAPPTETK